MWVWLQHVLLLLVTGFGLSVASVLGPTFDFDAFSLDLFSGDSDDLGSGYEASSFVLPSVINNSSKEDAIDEYIIVDEDGADHEEDDNLYVEVEAHSVGGSGGSGSGDHDEFIQNEMFNVVDVGSGEAVDEEAHGSGEAVHEDAHGSGAEDENDVGSVEILGGDVVNGYRIMGEKYEYDYAYDYDYEEDEDLYVDVEAQSVDGSGGSGSGDHDEFIQNEMLNVVDVDDVGSGEAVDEEAQGSGSEDENDVGSVEILGGDVVNGYRIMGVSSNQVAPDNSVEESLVENDEISLEVNVEAAESPELAVEVTEAADITSEPPKMETSSPVTVKKPEDDYLYSYDYDYNYNYDIDYEEDEGEDIHEILDYLNLVETTTPPVEDIIDYLNSMEIAEPLTIPRTEEEVMERKWDEFDDDLDEHEMTMSEHLDDWNKFSEHKQEMIVSGAGSKQAAILVVVMSFVIAPLFWI